MPAGTIPSSKDLPGAAPRGWTGAAGWRPVSGAFATSLALHALALACVAAILVPLPSGRPDASSTEPIAVTLVGAPVAGAPASAPPPPAATTPPPASGPMASTAAGGPAVPPSPPAPSSPWAGLPIDTDLPPAMLGSPMTPEGVEFYETRNVALLGADLERKISVGFPREPDRPIRLKPDAVIGYPLDALAQGIEGTVVVWFVVDADGEVVERQAVAGPPELAEYTLTRLGAIVDQPALVGDRPVRAWMALEVTFSGEAARTAADASTPGAAPAR